MYKKDINGFEVGFGIGKTDRINYNLDNELDVLNSWIKILNERYSNDFKIVENSTDYTTLKLNDYDFLRLKYGKNAKWIKLLMVKPYSQKYIDDDRFKDETKKNKVYWKSTLNDADISKYFDILDDEYDFIIKEQ